MTLQELYKVVYNSSIRINDEKTDEEYFKGNINELPEELMNDFIVLNIEGSNYLGLQVYVEKF